MSSPSRPHSRSSSFLSQRSLNRPAAAHLQLPDFPPSPKQNIVDTASTPPTSPLGVILSSAPTENSFEQFSETLYDETNTMIREFPWAETSTGPRDTWPDHLVSLVGLMRENPHPAAIWYGKDLNLIYNGAYATMAGAKHPWMLGKPASIVWGERWPKLEPLVETVFGGKSIAKQDELLMFDRLTEKNLPEETYHSWTWVPITDPRSRVVGIYNPTFDTTSQVLAARRLRVLASVCERVMIATNLKDFIQTLLEVLSDTEYEAPFAALYTASALSGNDSKRQSPADLADPAASVTSGGPIAHRLDLEGSLGVPEQIEGGSHPMLPRSFEADLTVMPYRLASARTAGTTASTSGPRVSPLTRGIRLPLNRNVPSDASDFRSVRSDRSTSLRSPSSDYDWSESIQIAMRLGYAVHVPLLPSDLMKDVSTSRGWNDVVREAVVLPITVDGETGAGTTQLVLILGVNSRRAYDKAYSSWIDVLRLTLCSALSAVFAREAETRRADQLAQLDGAKTVFFSNASHELRTPLTLIAGPLGEVLAKNKDHWINDKLGLASRNVARLARLVDSLLDVSKIEAGRLTGRFGPVRLTEFTEDLASLFRSTIEKNGIKYNVECPSDDQTVYVDPDLWEKITFNLIGNAFKYTLKGAITVTMQVTPHGATLSVSDSGVGIPAQDIERIFERFQRVEATARSHEGTGIGLALTKELVKLHGGTITVTSVAQAEDKDNHGSTFTVTIPMGHAHLPQAYVEETSIAIASRRAYARGIIEEAAQWGRHGSAEVSTPSDTSEESTASSSGDSTTVFFSKSDTVLIVDDNSDMRRYIRSIFSRHCTVVDACNGREALDLMESKEVVPNVVVTDRMMPVMDGDTLLVHMKAHRELRMIPVVMVTADASDDARVDGLMAGADDYISKPFSSRSLLARTHLQMQIGKKKAQLEANFEGSTSQLRVLSELAPVGIFRAEPSGKITWANPTWYELTQHNNVSALDDWLDFVVPEERDSVQESWSQLCEFLSPQRLVMEFSFTSGRCVQAQFNVLEGKVLGTPIILGTLTDISERRMLQQAQLSHAEERETAARGLAEDAETRRQEADDRRRAQELLIDVTSHELRQPVSAILNCCSLVRSNYRALRDVFVDTVRRGVPFIPTPDMISEMDQDLEALDAIYQCGLSQERIANDVLSLSRIQLEVLSIIPTEFDLPAETTRICSLFQNEFHMKTIQFDLLIGSSVSQFEATRVCMDKSRFGQVVTNLLSNAIKFTEINVDRARKIEVSLEVSPQPPSSAETCVPPLFLDGVDPDDSSVFVYVSVKDSGLGLQPDDLNLLFQRFSQGSNSHKVFGGSGLGLFVSRKLCQLMGGRIEVESQFGEGANFRFFVKALKTRAKPPTTNPATRDPFTDLPTRAMRVLITEDNQINQTVLNRQLRKRGCETALANNGAEAIETMRELNRTTGGMFDVVLMDCEMPVMNGYDAAREIRRLEAEGPFTRRNCVIALTGNARAAQVQSALDAGMDAVMIKPYNIDKLLGLMHERVTGNLALLQTPIPISISPISHLPSPPAGPEAPNGALPMSLHLVPLTPNLSQPTFGNSTSFRSPTSPTLGLNLLPTDVGRARSSAPRPATLSPLLSDYSPASLSRLRDRSPPPPPPLIRALTRRLPPPTPFPPPASVQMSMARPALPTSFSSPRTPTSSLWASDENIRIPTQQGVKGASAMGARVVNHHVDDAEEEHVSVRRTETNGQSADPFAASFAQHEAPSSSAKEEEVKLAGDPLAASTASPDVESPTPVPPMPVADDEPGADGLAEADNTIDSTESQA